MYFCSALELPKDFSQLKHDETLILTEERIEDWMIIADGVLYGGYSLRVLRELVALEERQQFDDHIGVTEYRDGLPMNRWPSMGDRLRGVFRPTTS